MGISVPPKRMLTCALLSPTHLSKLWWKHCEGRIWLCAMAVEKKKCSVEKVYLQKATKLGKNGLTFNKVWSWAADSKDWTTKNPDLFIFCSFVCIFCQTFVPVHTSLSFHTEEIGAGPKKSSMWQPFVKEDGKNQVGTRSDVQKCQIPLSNKNLSTILSSKSYLSCSFIHYVSHLYFYLFAVC